MASVGPINQFIEGWSFAIRDDDGHPALSLSFLTEEMAQSVAAQLAPLLQQAILVQRPNWGNFE